MKLLPGGRADVASGEALRFSMLGLRLEVDCDEPDLRAAIRANFGQMLTCGQGDRAVLGCRVTRTSGSSFSLVSSSGARMAGSDLSELIYLLEKEVTVQLQLRRPDLLFLHAAALEYEGEAWLIAGDSGAGKSTTAWALLHHGCRYMSDELAPVDLSALTVHPYPHALCLKQRPPSSYAPGAHALALGATLHIPTQSLPAGTITRAIPLAGLFLLDGHQRAGEPSVRRSGAAHTAARLYTAALNQLAHSQRGIDAVVRLAQRFPAFALRSAELSRTCAAILRRMQGLS